MNRGLNQRQSEKHTWEHADVADRRDNAVVKLSATGLSTKPKAAATSRKTRMDRIVIRNAIVAASIVVMV